MLFLKRRYTCFKNNNLWIILNLLHALWIWANNFRKMIDRINNIPTFHSFPWLSRKKIKNRPVNNKLQTGILGISLFGKPGNYLAGNKFRDFWLFSQPQNTSRVWDSIFPNIWLKYDIDTRISHISISGNEIRVSVTYLVTITLINNRKKNDIQGDFRFLILLKSRN